MANYQPRVNLSWRYLKSATSPDPNLEILWAVDIDVDDPLTESFSFEVIQGINALITLDSGGEEGIKFAKSWSAPFNVPRNLEDNATNRELIMQHIRSQSYVRVTTNCKVDGKSKGETVNQTTHNSNIGWII